MNYGVTNLTISVPNMYYLQANNSSVIGIIVDVPSILLLSIKIYIDIIFYLIINKSIIYSLISGNAVLGLWEMFRSYTLLYGHPHD